MLLHIQAFVNKNERELKKGIFRRRGHFCTRRPYKTCSNRVFTHIDLFFWILQIKKSEVKTSSKWRVLSNYGLFSKLWTNTGKIKELWTNTAVLKSKKTELNE